MTREVPIEYKVNRAANSPDTQRHQLNRILEDIREKLESAGLSGDYVTQQELEAALAGLDLGGRVDVVVGGVAISVNSSNPAAPVVSVDISGLVSTDVGNNITIGTDGGLFASGGGSGPSGTTTVIRTGSDLQVGDSTSVEYAPADAGPWTGWAMTIHPAGGTAQVDVLVAGVSITSGGTSPNVSTGTSDTGSTSGWAGDSISAGQSFEVQVTAVTGIVERIDVYLHP